MAENTELPLDEYMDLSPNQIREIAANIKALEETKTPGQ